MKFRCEKCNISSEESRGMYTKFVDFWLCKNHSDEFNFLYHNFFQPERSKLEDLEHKYCYKLIDGIYPTADEMVRGYLFSKDEANSWKEHGGNRSWHEIIICNVFSKMRCSEHYGNTVKNK